MVEANGQPGAVTYDRDGHVVNVLALDIADGVVQAIRCVVNPDKLHLGPVSELARGAVAGTTDRSVVRISMSRTDRGAPDRYRRLPSPGGGQKAPPEAVTFSGQALTGIPVGAEVGSSSARNASRGC